MPNLEKLYQSVAENIVQRCHGAIKITKHGKIIEVYDTRRHIWSDGLAGLIIKEESKNANLRDWEVARCIRPRIISMLLEDTTSATALINSPLFISFPPSFIISPQIEGLVYTS